jgi:outer membrane receptor protein involved in Fe transport
MYWKYKMSGDALGSYLYDDLSYDAFFKGTTEWDSGSLSSTYDFGGSQLIYTFSRGEITLAQVGELAPGDNYGYITSVEVRTNELRWASTGQRRVDWTVGAYLRDASRDDVLDMPSYGIYSSSVQDNSGYALFGEVNFNLSQQWSLTAGLRYFSDDVDATEVTEAGDAGGLDASFDSWNPRLSLSYKPSDGTTLYASVARGFRSGQMQPISALQLAELYGISLPSQISPDSIWTYEIGAKSMFLDNRLLLEGAIYQSEWKDVAVRVPIQGLFNGLVNSAGTTTRGIEGSAVYNPNRDLTLQLGLSYVDSEYREDVPDTTFRRGMQAYNVPRFTAASQIGYGWDVGEQLRGIASFTARHESPRRTPIFEGGSAGDAITELSAKVGLESPAGWGAYVYVRNLTNEDGAVSSRDPDLVDMDGNLLDRGAATRLVPRTVGVLLRYDY